MSFHVSKRPIRFFLELNLLVLERSKVYFKFKFKCYFFSSKSFGNEESKMNCISRADYEDKNLFIQKSNIKRRWNLFSQIAIKNNTLRCANEDEVYDLTKSCQLKTESKRCTLLDTNEVVDIGFSSYPS